MAVSGIISGRGVGLTWTSCFGSEVNSIITGNAILSSTQIDNSVALDQFCDFSFSLGSITPTGAPFIGVYLMPLNQEGTTYGDGRFGSSAVGPPGGTYFIANVTINAAAQVQTGAITYIPMPAGKFKFAIHNASGVSLAASANTLSYRTYNLRFV